MTFQDIHEPENTIFRAKIKFNSVSYLVYIAHI